MKTELFDKIDQLISEGDISAATNLLQQARQVATTPTDHELLNSFEALLQQPPKTSKHLDKAKPKTRKPGISFVSCSMNRHDNLLKSLKSWLTLDVNEIILVDWSSEKPLVESLSEAQFDDPRIRVIRIENETRWILTLAFNVGLRAASYEITYKLDADIVTSNDFLKLNQVSRNQLVRGLWKQAFDINQKDQMYVNGSFGCYTQHLEDIGYYNEFIRSYGWDDSDLYYRLTEHCGLETKHLNIKSITHLTQEESTRTEFQDINEDYFLDKIRPTIFNNTVNKIITALWDIWTPDKCQKYDLRSNTKGDLINGHRATKAWPIPDWVSEQATLAAANQFIAKLEPVLATRYNFSADLGRWFLAEFAAKTPVPLAKAIVGNYFNFGMEVFVRDAAELKKYLGYSRARYVLVEGEERENLEIGKKTIVSITKDDLKLINSLRASAGFSAIKTNGLVFTKTLKKEILTT